MTPEFGAASQLEKIDMLDFADFVAINKFDRKGAADALRDVRKQVQRNREAFGSAPDEMPVFGTIAARFNDDGVTALYQALAPRLRRAGPARSTPARCRRSATRHSDAPDADRAAARARATSPRSPRPCAATSSAARAQATLARERAAAARQPTRMLQGGKPTSAPTPPTPSIDLADEREARARRATRSKLLEMWPDMQQGLRGRRVRREDPRQGDPHRARRTRSLSGTQDPQGRAAALRGRRRDPAAGCCWRTCRAASRTPPACSRSSARTRTRRACSPARATPFRTNRRFKLLSDGMPAKRLSTAFDSVTLYGNDPDRAARHLRQGRQLRRVDRDARRHEGAVLGLRPVRPERPRCR